MKITKTLKNPYLNQNGWYTKIGTQVTVNIFLNVSAVTGTGVLRIGNLPFSTKSTSNYQGSFPLLVGGLNWTGGTTLTGYYGNAQNYLLLYGMQDDGGYSGQDCVNESFDLYITASYFMIMSLLAWLVFFILTAGIYNSFC
jgi:hypothetical protein